MQERRALLETSPETCAALWTGDAEHALRGIALLPEPELRRFARAVAAVVRAAATGDAVTTPEDAAARFQAFVDDLVTQGRGAALVAAWDAPTDQVLACAAIRSVMDAIGALPAEERAEVARTMFVADAATRRRDDAAP